MRSAGPVFGKRTCKVCLEEVYGPTYGEHVMGHGLAQVVPQWEGGAKGLMDDLGAALKQSMAEAEGYPEVQETIAASQQMIVTLTRAIMAANRDQN
jgi:hypothetical protein